MPGLDTKLHTSMVKSHRRRSGVVPRVLRALRGGGFKKELYGMRWGDPETVPPLKFVRDMYVLPYVNAAHSALEIGPGGGRWTRYLLGFGKLYAVEYYSETLEELKKNFNKPNMTFIKNNGTDFPGVAEQSIDFLFSFGVFVHLDLDLIEGYLTNMKPILKPGSNVVIQYADKTKIMAQQNEGFSDNNPEKMRAMLLERDYKILEEDLTTMWNSSIVRFTI